METKDKLWKYAYLGAALAVFLVDQITKAWAARVLRFRQSMEVIPDFFNLTYATNTGVAFSQFNDYGDVGRWGLSALALVAAIGVLIYFWRTPRTQDRVLGACALLLAGILGNLTDRVRLGFVIDFIDFEFGSWHYPTFNVADMAICVGAFLLILDMFLNKPEAESKLAKD